MGIENLREQIEHKTRNGEGFPLEEAVEIIVGMEEDQRWEAIKHEFKRTAEITSLGIPTLFFLVDNTAAGGSHVIRALFHPVFEMVVVEIPQENQSGRFPTVLHALEVAATFTRLNNEQGNDTVPHPRAKFLQHEPFEKLAGQVREVNISLIPLIVNPVKTNCVIFHSQARRLNPETIAQEYHKLLAKVDLTKDLMRHTMLVTCNNPPYVPVAKDEFVVGVCEHSKVGQHFRLINVGRIGHWGLDERGPLIRGANLIEPLIGKGRWDYLQGLRKFPHF